MIGHAATRYHAIGEESLKRDRHPTTDELQTMQSAIDEAMEAGALGFSASRTLTHKTSEGRLGTFEMIAADLWDEYLWGELGAAVRDFESEPWGKSAEETPPESS